MVLRVCRASLRDPDAADDAFQATFLVLARRAGSLRVGDTVGPWLHGVAQRVAAGSRGAESRRKALQKRYFEKTPTRIEEPSRDDLGPALHDAIERLPEPLRAAVVLCYLQGLTHEEAATSLGWPVGTVRSRLARARDQLRRRLTRLGWTTSSALPHLTLRPLALPPSLVAHTIQMAAGTPYLVSLGFATFLEGPIRMLVHHPMRVLAGFLVVVGAGVGLAARPTPAQPAQAAKPARSTEDRLEALERELQEVRGRLAEAERRLARVETNPNSVGGSPVALGRLAEGRSLVRVRSQLDDVYVRRVLVEPGRSVAKGQPLLQVSSHQLALAKQKYQLAYVKWDHDRKYLLAREPLARDGRITHIVWTDTQNDEKKSRLDYLVTREQLLSLGLTSADLGRLVKSFGDEEARNLAAEPAQLEEMSSLTILAPVGGRVVEVNAEADNFYTAKDVLLLLEKPAEAKPEVHERPAGDR
jgi:RNA polymerase sigma factor (sigma-70 family)